ncbi:MAG: hypothetical protein WCW35_14350 [Bacteroidota bacterium]
MIRLLLTTLICTFTLPAQQPVKSDSSLFDFWIGEWELSWKDPDGTTASGKNSITKILDGTVIREHFEALTGQSKGFKGESVSLLDQRTGEWKQTWVDNQYSYLPFTGGDEKSGERFFAQEFIGKKGFLVKQKMVFRSITKNSFTWDWMNSLDSGKTWITNWSINYMRKK